MLMYVKYYKSIFTQNSQYIAHQLNITWNYFTMETGIDGQALTLTQSAGALPVEAELV